MIFHYGAAHDDGAQFRVHDAHAAPKKSVARKSERRPEPAVCKYGGLAICRVPDSVARPTKPYKVPGDF